MHSNSPPLSRGETISDAFKSAENSNLLGEESATRKKPAAQPGARANAELTPVP
jgi:hypothetical protein